MELPTANNISFKTAIIPILVFLGLLLYGLLIHPQWLGGEMLPVEVLVLIAFSFNVFYLFFHGYSWTTIEENVTKKIGETIPIVLILFCIGVLIGSWIISGTIPMLIHFGISVIEPNWIYIFSFFICIVFSLLTGTSWGSAGTIGIVMIGISDIYEANAAITAGAIIGGSFFGDKISPLSDTTNVASLATDVPLMDHIKSMLYTTLPSAILAAIAYIALSPTFYGTEYKSNIPLENIENTLADLESMFNFNALLLVPLLIVIWGSVKQKPIIITLLTSAWVALILALIFQNFNIDQIFSTLKSGFTTDMVSSQLDIKSDVVNILNRGGLYNLIEGVVICLLIFMFIGTLEVIDAINISIKPIMLKLKNASSTIVATLISTLITNITTSNQYATSFIIGTAFRGKYDKLKIPRKVLSRSLEDAGTMMENLFPWTPSGIFMAATLGVSTIDYAQFQFISLINIVIAFIFAITGIACFLPKKTINNE
jgi:NhaC family Na+:H+ antiporter